MERLKITWTILSNLIAVSFFVALLILAETNFQIVLTSAVALIYIAISYNMKLIAGLQLASDISALERNIKIAKISSQELDLEPDEVELKETRELFDSQIICQKINVGFHVLIFIVAVGAAVFTVV